MQAVSNTEKSVSERGRLVLDHLPTHTYHLHLHLEDPPTPNASARTVDRAHGRRVRAAADGAQVGVCSARRAAREGGGLASASGSGRALGTAGRAVGVGDQAISITARLTGGLICGSQIGQTLGQHLMGLGRPFGRGADLFKITFQFDQPVRAVSFAIGDEKMLITTDPFMGVNAAIHIVEITKNREEQTSKILKTISGDGIVNGRLNRVAWGALNETFLTAGEDGVLRVWDVETGKVLHEARDAHKGKPIQHLELSADKTHAITASLDKTAKIFDAQNLELLKTYVADRPVNAAIISPIREHIILGGGQDAMAVTTTSSKAGKFDSKIYHKIFEEEIGGIRGHFGPINALAFCPDGKSFTSGGEDGYARIHHLDNTYFDIK